MAKAELKQTVKPFHDEDTKANQLVILETDPEQKFWLTIQHAGNEISLSLDNWEKLTQLVNNAKKILKINK